MTINVLGVDLELDVFDANVFETYEAAVNEVSRKVTENDELEGQKTSQKLRFQCTMIKEFFDEVFGPGTSDKLFHGKDNIKDCIDAYLAVIKKFNEEAVELSESMTKNQAELMRMYEPDEYGDE